MCENNFYFNGFIFCEMIVYFFFMYKNFKWLLLIVCVNNILFVGFDVGICIYIVLICLVYLICVNMLIILVWIIFFCY